MRLGVGIALLTVAACGSGEVRARAGAGAAADAGAAAVAAADAGTGSKIDACVAHLDDDADPLHADITPAVVCLAEQGWPAIAKVAPLLDAASPMTRLHAERALERITMRYYGYEAPRAGEARLEPVDPGWPRGGQARWTALWKQIDYVYDAPVDARRAAAARFAAWAKGRRGVDVDVAAGEVQGGLVPELVEEAARASWRRFHDCYHVERGDADPEFTWSVQVDVSAKGVVKLGNAIHNAPAKLATCFTREASALKLPATPSGATTFALRVRAVATAE